MQPLCAERGSSSFTLSWRLLPTPYGMAASEYAYLCTILIGVLSSSTALQGSNVNVENGIGGYQVGRLYAYSFLSSAQILENVNLTIQAQVSS